MADHISRRRFLLTGGLGTALALPVARRAHAQGAHGHAHSPAVTAGAPASVPGAVGQPLVEPEVRRSINGELSTTLRVRYGYKTVGGYRLYVRTYEGTSPGPTLRVRPGDTLRINLVNDLPPNRDVAPASMHQPHHFNSTNFHFHGSHVSPSGIADNVLRDMPPGDSYPVEIAIPRDHTRGTYWYHPHNHGGAAIQVASGMAGAVVIEGDFDAVPEIAQAQERTLLLTQVIFDQHGMVEDFNTLFPETATRFFAVNGQRAPVIRMRPGEVQRWRLLHGGYQDTLQLQLDKHALHAIAHDGIALPSVDPREKLVITPGQRADFLVQAGAPGTYELAALPYDIGYPAPTGPVARLIVEGAPMAMRLPTALPSPPLPTIRDAELTGSRALVMSARSPEVDAAGTWQEFSFMVDGKHFDPKRVDHRIKLNSVEEWTVSNTHQHDHVFHIHTNPFQVTKINGQPQASPVWRDTVTVPRFGSLTFRSRFTDYTGRYVLHCHMMNHELLGMMQLIEVYEG